MELLHEKIGSPTIWLKMRRHGEKCTNPREYGSRWCSGGCDVTHATIDGQAFGWSFIVALKHLPVVLAITNQC